ncbi:MAG TPA: rhodanese-like domain-containing protein [Miltoncostaea sp.]|nr:rhodanese-like domain-containing protein [Miltoncostaea sp.]
MATGVDALLRTARARLRRLTPAEAYTAAAAGGVIVDIRSDGQRAADGLVPGALVVPRNVLEWRADPGSPERDPRIVQATGPVVLMCAEGFQSSLAAATLQDLGVSRATDMAGGFVAWRAAGLPVERPDEDGPAAHWDRTYATRGPEGVSWFEVTPATSLEMIRRAGAGPCDPIVDVGGGASRLAGAALAAGFRDVTVLDLSARALADARARLGDAAARVSWAPGDVRTWVPPRRYAVWHDRAVLHFLTAKADRRRYAATLAAALRAGGRAVVAAFAPDGPPRCSGLAVARWTPEEIAAELGLHLVEGRRTEHRTPSGTVQPLSWALLRRG